MFVFHLFLYLFGLLCITECQYYFVTAPNVIRYEHNETVTVSVFGLTNQTVKVWLEQGGKQFSNSSVVVQNEKNPNRTTVRVREVDILAIGFTKGKPRTIKICSLWQSHRQCRDVIISYHSGYLFIQTDKPIYTPLQKVKIRTLALDESLKPSEKQQLSMEIISPSNMTLGRTTIDGTENGFFTHQFTLPPYPDIGVWTARAFYRGKFETSSRVQFQVEEYVLPTFDVTAEVDVPHISRDTTSISISVRAKYVYNKPVDGTARLTLNLKDRDRSTQYIMDMNPKPLIKDVGNDGSVSVFNVPVQEILESPLLKGKAFPDGKMLEVLAIVYESATGKEEVRSDDSTMFALKPFVFSFTRSKKHFRPGMEYNLKVEMTHVNGEPAADKNVIVEMFINGKSIVRKDNLVTDTKGQIGAGFVTRLAYERLQFNVSTMGQTSTSELFVVESYKSENQIQVEQIVKDNKSQIRAIMNTKGEGYTGMLFMIVTRGEVVYTLFENATNHKTEEIEYLQRLIMPSARVLVFYVEKATHELVADSSKFEVDERCNGAGLSLSTLRRIIKPGETDILTVTGSPHMWVGMNVMDKALLLLNNKNVLKKNSMFDALRSHDLGCGEGSGRSSGEVFKNSGLTILTNAAVAEGDLKRETDECDSVKRNKRYADDCYGANPICCQRAFELVEQLLDEADEPERIDPYTKCYAKARVLALERKLTTKCIMAYFDTCKTALENAITDQTKIVSKSVFDDGDYASDLQKLRENNVRPVTRSDFRESWLFNVVHLNEKGKYTEVLHYPDSITEWMFQAIGISQEDGMCIAEPIHVEAFKDFFIQLDLPYKAVRLENIDIKATIFNYGRILKTASVYVEGVDDLCFSSEPNKPSPRTQIELPPNSASTVTFPMIPIKKGLFSIKVYAMVTHLGIPDVDVVEKKLLVVNEGIEEKLTIQLCLDPNEDQVDCINDDRVVSNVVGGNTFKERILTVDLTLPLNSISGTGSATGYFQGSIMDNVVLTLINGVETLFAEPYGCGEQNMMRLAPTVYAMSYLRQTNQVTSVIEQTGTRLIRDGVIHQNIVYRKPNGPYSVWSGNLPQVRLTAYVAKVFCQAQATVDNSVDDADINMSLNWLANQAQSDGSFFHSGSLTSFVLVSFLECTKRNQTNLKIVNDARRYVEGLDREKLRKDSYTLALSTYALELADSPEKWKLKQLLEDAAHKESTEQMHWKSSYRAMSVETTSYALLAMLTLNDLRSSAAIVRSLTANRDAQGAFRSSTDSAIALQALSLYSARTFSSNIQLQVTLFAKNWENMERSITNENVVARGIAQKLPVETAENKLMVKVTGLGSGRMIIDLRYNRPAKSDEICPFNVGEIDVQIVNDFPKDYNIATIRKCDVCGKCDEPDQPEYDDDAFGNTQEIEQPTIKSNFGKKKRDVETLQNSLKCIRFSVSSKTDEVFGMSIVNFGLETDVQVDEDDLKKLVKDSPNIARYELPSNGKGFLIFYLNEISRNETKFVFRLKDNYKRNTDTRQPSYVKVYDYYNPDKNCMRIYGTGPNRDGGINYQCNEKTEQCNCVRSTCATHIKQELLQLLKDKQQPAIKLKKYTCTKSNYAHLVTIDTVTNDTSSEAMVARGSVLESINQGIQNLTKNANMTFFWKPHCHDVNLEQRKEYYVIGKDGYKVSAENVLEFWYPLTNTELIIEKDEDARVQSIMDVYTKMMKHGCGT